MNKKKNKTPHIVSFLLLAVLVVVPSISFADVASSCGSVTGSGLGGLFNCANTLVGGLIDIVWMLAFLFFLWGVTKFMMAGEDKAKRDEGRQFMIWGVIALFVMFAFWGFVQILSNTFGIPAQGPQLNTGYNSSTGNDYANSAANLVPPGSNQSVY